MTAPSDGDNSRRESAPAADVACRAIHEGFRSRLRTRRAWCAALRQRPGCGGPVPRRQALRRPESFCHRL